MPTNVIMPQLGESVVEGTISKWLKQEGETVQAFEPLLEISTDKVDSEIPAPADGVLLKIHVREGETVERGTLLAVIGQVGEPLGEQPTDAPAPVGAHGNAPVNGHAAGADHAPQLAAAHNGGHPNGKPEYSGHVTPVVARMAAEHQLDLAQIEGTGREGRVTKKDVEAYLARQPEAVTELEPWETPGDGNLFKPTVEYGAEADPVGAQRAVPTPQTARPRPPG